MKTISLTDQAYDRLAAWKSESTDSFSKVVLRLVPPKYTGEAILRSAQELPRLTSRKAAQVEDEIARANDWSTVDDPWTS